MKNSLFIKTMICFSFILSSNIALAKNKIMMAGDSWVYLPCIFGSFNKALKHSNLEQVEILKCRPTSKPGIQAEQWLGSKEHAAVLKNLYQDNNKEIKIIYLSLGGNDFVNYWNDSLNNEEENVVFEKITNNIEQIVGVYNQLRPDIKILISGYDYPRFTSTNKIAQYRKVFARMGEPLPQNINQAIVRFSNMVSTLSNTNKNIFYIQHYGLMHYYIGISQAQIAKGKTLAPDLISSLSEPNKVGGEIDYQGDIKSYLSVLTISDAFHLSKYGFYKLAEHSFDVRMKHWLKSETANSNIETTE